MEKVYVFYCALNAEITGKSGRDFLRFFGGPVDPGGSSAMPPSAARLCPHPIEPVAAAGPVHGTTGFDWANVYQIVIDE